LIAVALIVIIAYDTDYVKVYLQYGNIYNILCNRCMMMWFVYVYTS